MPRKIVSFGWMGTSFFLLVLEELQNTICVSKTKKERHFVNTICFGEHCPFYVLVKKQRTIQNRGFSRQRGKQKIQVVFEKGVFGRGLWKAVCYLWSAKAVFWFYSVFSKTQPLQSKKVFLSLLFAFLFRFLFCCFSFLERAPKRPLSCNFGVFFPQKFFKILLFLLSVCFFFSLLFSLSNPRRFHFWLFGSSVDVWLFSFCLFVFLLSYFCCFWLCQLSCFQSMKNTISPQF